ncbi:MAG: hypothetical protein K2X29_05475 [Candidatus Obscuribacterales bacterium]|nr:hypothetical protein [Candidatus Obscuribacterales bacterium]
MFTVSYSAPSTPGTYNWVAYDADKLFNIRYTIDYSTPRVLSFSIAGENHLSTPIPLRSAFSVWDSDYSATVPIFEGFVAEIQMTPESNIVNYLCYDATWKANDITILSAAATDSTATPRLIFNATDEDSDFPSNRNLSSSTAISFSSVGEIINTILTDTYTPLVLGIAAPPLNIGGDAFVLTDLNLLDFKPQDKVVFQSEKVRTGITRLLQFMPNFRLLFLPSTRKWRFFDVFASPLELLTLNDFTQSELVLTMQLQRISQDRYPAVRIRGPEVPKMAIAQTGLSPDLGASPQVYDGITITPASLDPDWTFSQTAQFEASGPLALNIGNAGLIWKLNSAFSIKRIGRVLPRTIAVPQGGGLTGSFLFTVERLPILLYTFGELDSNSKQIWYNVGGLNINYQLGIITAPTRLFQDKGTSATPRWKLPTNAMFVFPSFDPPFEARFPASGFDGTSATVGGSDAVLEIFDDSLSIGYHLGIPITSTSRINEFKKLAEYIHKTKKDIAYSGSIVLLGIHYKYLDLNKRINITAVNENGQPLTTGLESMNAPLTQVEYDYSDGIGKTILSLNSDMAAYLLTDIESQKRFLGIRAKKLITQVNTYLDAGFQNGRGFLSGTSETLFFEADA